MRKIAFLTVALLMCTSFILTAQSSPPAPVKITFNSKPNIEYGFEERVRLEDWDNIIDHSKSASDYRTQYRFRTRIWTSFKFGNRIEIMAGINNENRKITDPNMAYNGREVIFETLWADYKFTPRWSVRFGRQNIMRGEGFVIFDGNALDGSRTAYFNALNLTKSFGKSKLEFLAISNPRKDQYLPRLNEASHVKELQRLTEWDERAFGAYLTYSELTDTKLEAYLFHKTETNDYRAVSHPQYQPDRKVNAIGGRAVHNLGRGFSLGGEYAYESGSQDPKPGVAGSAADIRGWGGYARLKKEFGSEFDPSLSLAYIGMSGDDLKTKTIEGWDPLFSRWPKWSELYIYTYAPETGVAYWTNTAMWEADFRIYPCNTIGLRATFYRLSAYKNWAAKGKHYGPGKKRGDLLQLRADFTFSQNLKAHFLYEYLRPGNFYSGKDSGHFLRLELSYTLKKLY